MFMPSGVAAAAGTSPVQVLGATVTDIVIDPSNALAGYRLNSNGDEEIRIGAGAYAFLSRWLLVGVASDYEAQYTAVGDATAPDPPNVWKSLGANNTFEQSQTVVGSSSSTGTIKIRRATDSTELAAAVLNIEATVDV